VKRNFVSPSYEKNKKFREETKEHVKDERKLIVGENEFIRKVKDFREKV